MEIRKLLPGKFDNLVRNYEFSNKEIHKKWWEMFLHSWKIYIFSSRDDKLIFPCSLVLHLAYFQGHKQVLHHFLYHCILELMHLLICSLLRVVITYCRHKPRYTLSIIHYLLRVSSMYITLGFCLCQCTSLLWFVVFQGFKY